jgi:hypothetical protein
VDFARLTNGFTVSHPNSRSFWVILGPEWGDAENLNWSLAKSVNPNSAYSFAAFFGSIKF